MKSGSDYRMRMAVCSQPSVDPDLEDAVVERFLFTDCTCPAGKGPHAMCKHLSALLYALEDFCREGYVHESTTCTSRLQKDNLVGASIFRKAICPGIAGSSSSRALISRTTASSRRERTPTLSIIFALCWTNWKGGSSNVPERTICVDEKLLKWHGRRGFKQYIPAKRASFGVKTFFLCDTNGYLWNFQVWKLLEKHENWHHFCVHAQWWWPWRRKNVEKRHFTLSKLTFLLINCDRQERFSQSERRRADLQNAASDFLIFALRLSYDLSKFSDDFTPFLRLWKTITKSLGKN